MRSRVLVGLAILALVVAVIVLVVLWGGHASPDRELPGTGIPDCVLTGSEDTLYLFSGDNISAISSDGRLIYNYTVPEGWGLSSRWYVETSGDNVYLSESADPIACEDNGTLYLYLKQGNHRSVGLAGRFDYNDSNASAGCGTGMLVALDGSGRTLWTLNVTDLTMKLEYHCQLSSDVSLDARGGLLYLFHDYNETVVSASGTILWSVGSVSGPGAVDDAGNLYVVNAVEPWFGLTIPEPNVDGTAVAWDYRVPGSVIDAYGPDGSLRWQQYSLDAASRQDELSGLPLYHGGIVYVPSEKSVTAIGVNGSRLWVKMFDSNDYPYNMSEIMGQYIWSLLPSSSGPSNVVPSALLVDYGFRVYPLMPFDSLGNLYIQHPLAGMSGPSAYSFLIKVSPDGQEVSSRIIRSDSYLIASSSALINVSIEVPGQPIGVGTAGLFNEVLPVSGPAADGGSVDNLTRGTLSAYDPGTGAFLWNFTVPVDRRTTLTLDASNVADLIPADEREVLDSVDTSGIYPDNSSVSRGVVWGVQSFKVYPGNGVIYVDFQTYDFDAPIVYGQSRYVYSGGVYALGYNGTLLWYVPMAPDASVISASNGTIIYNTWDGKTFAKAVGTAVAGGVAVVSAAYLTFCFFTGTVARARGRLEQNGNRTTVFDYVVRNPGSTLYEIARGTGINRGTVRYHLFILGVNHRVVAHEAGEKFVRYFTNAGTYGGRERTIISLLRRGTTGNVLRLVAARPGIGSPEIARALGMQESVAHRCIKELLDQDVLTREAAGRGYIYSLKEDDRALVAQSIEKLARAENGRGEGRAI